MFITIGEGEGVNLGRAEWMLLPVQYRLDITYGVFIYWALPFVKKQLIITHAICFNFSIKLEANMKLEKHNMSWQPYQTINN